MLTSSVIHLLDPSPLHLDPDAQRQALLGLICHLAYREGDFTLSSGRRSSYYINCKPVTLHPQGAYLVGWAMLRCLPPQTEAVAGMTLGADPIVSAVSLVSILDYDPGVPHNLPALIVRKQAKGHGTQAWLEGMTLPPETHTWILEDVVTTGGSALQAAERVREAGYCVDGILSLVDRQEGASESYAAAGIPFQAVFTLADLRATYKQLTEKSKELSRG
ncbi:MAG: orotate phosphoribosyltransferase [Synechococcaceae cyanobacterium SM2_3_2]|nr:orotate phosphoribosyltransferase [Synechococcaceae cyanobacterium SM2_3_2]